MYLISACSIISSSIDCSWPCIILLLLLDLLDVWLLLLSDYRSILLHLSVIAILITIVPLSSYNLWPTIFLIKLLGRRLPSLFLAFIVMEFIFSLLDYWSSRLPYLILFLIGILNLISLYRRNKYRLYRLRLSQRLWQRRLIILCAKLIRCSNSIPFVV